MKSGCTLQRRSLSLLLLTGVILSCGGGGGGGGGSRDPTRNGQNPFSDGVYGAPEGYLYGLRNPWRSDQDPVTNQLWIGDVDQDLVEDSGVFTRTPIADSIEGLVHFAAESAGELLVQTYFNGQIQKIVP